MSVEVITSSTLSAAPDAVWARIASLAGINDELAPWLRMSAPRGKQLTPEDVPLGRRWFRSWIFLFGVLPFDFDDLLVERLDPGHGFVERSKMLSARVWEHERTLHELPDGHTLLTDRVDFLPRLRGTERVHATIVRAIFRHRHKRLQRAFQSGG